MNRVHVHMIVKELILLNEVNMKKDLKTLPVSSRVYDIVKNKQKELIVIHSGKYIELNEIADEAILAGIDSVKE